MFINFMCDQWPHIYIRSLRWEDTLCNCTIVALRAKEQQKKNQMTKIRIKHKRTTQHLQHQQQQVQAKATSRHGNYMQNLESSICIRFFDVWSALWYWHFERLRSLFHSASFAAKAKWNATAAPNRWRHLQRKQLMRLFSNAKNYEIMAMDVPKRKKKAGIKMNHGRMHKNSHKCTMLRPILLLNGVLVAHPCTGMPGEYVCAHKPYTQKKNLKLYGDLTLNIHTFCAKSSRCSSLLVLKCTYITIEKKSRPTKIAHTKHTRNEAQRKRHETSKKKWSQEKES